MLATKERLLACENGVKKDPTDIDSINDLLKPLKMPRTLFEARAMSSAAKIVLY